ncbi:hypothetical protein D3A96_09530 [Robertkochia marina]|nr:hypothetical protein D3A96_09530 [Robertkochia marina]
MKLQIFRELSVLPAGRVMIFCKGAKELRSKGEKAKILLLAEFQTEVFRREFTNTKKLPFPWEGGPSV